MRLFDFSSDLFDFWSSKVGYQLALDGHYVAEQLSFEPNALLLSKYAIHRNWRENFKVRFLVLKVWPPRL